MVYIENDTTESHLLNNRICIVFENTSNDTIALLSKFRHYYGDSPGIQGYSLFFYHSKKPVWPQHGETLSPDIIFQKGDRVKVASKEGIKMIMNLP